MSSIDEDLEKDWQLVKEESDKSCISQSFQETTSFRGLVQKLEGSSGISYPSGISLGCALLLMLLKPHVRQPFETYKGTVGVVPSIAHMEGTCKNSYLPESDLEEILGGFYKHADGKLNSEKDESAKRKMHKKYFAFAKFGTLSARLAQRPSDDYQDYFNRETIRVEQEKYANHLIKMNDMDSGDWIEIQRLTAKVPVLQMGNKMQEALAATPEFKKTKSNIAKAKQLIDKLGNDPGSNTCARGQLVLLGFLSKVEAMQCMNAKEKLLEARKQLAEVINSVDSIDLLKDDEAKFRNAQKAIWWPEFFQGAFEAKEARRRGYSRKDWKVVDKHSSCMRFLSEHHIVTEQAYKEFGFFSE